MLQDAQAQVKIPPKAMWELYQKLAHDDSFRERLQSYPREVLNEYSLRVSDEYSFDTVTLPFKEEVAEAIQGVTAGHEFVSASTIKNWWALWVFWTLTLRPAQEQTPVKAAARRSN